jgi:RHS repeat-associated protein
LVDALGSVIAQAKDDQTIQNFYAYSAYGEVTALGPDEGNPIQYTSRENDQTGLYFYRARYYDPVLKQFISEDPIGITAGPNFYAYVDGSPVNLRDPEGLQAGPAKLGGDALKMLMEMMFGKTVGQVSEEKGEQIGEGLRGTTGTQGCEGHCNTKCLQLLDRNDAYSKNEILFPCIKGCVRKCSCTPGSKSCGCPDPKAPPQGEPEL